MMAAAPVAVPVKLLLPILLAADMADNLPVLPADSLLDQEKTVGMRETNRSALMAAQ
jgi:hypothetical protein